MRSIMAATLGVAALAWAAPAAAREYPWCADLPTDHGFATNCGFDTIEQCRATTSGIGGNCRPNGFYQAEPRAETRRKKQMHREYRD